MEERTYTVAEANALLPYVRSLVRQILDARTSVIQLQPELWPAVQKAALNGGSKAATQASRQIIAIQEALKALQRLNIMVRDVNTGLVDFPALRHGEVVYLCWQYDEPRVEYWHDSASGFNNRQGIDDSF